MPLLSLCLNYDIEQLLNVELMNYRDQNKNETEQDIVDVVSSSSSSC